MNVDPVPAPKVVISKFRGDFVFLSNFYPCSIEFDGVTSDVVSRKSIRDAQTPARAKQLGRSVQLRDDWERIKVDVMRDLVKKSSTILA